MHRHQVRPHTVSEAVLLYPKGGYRCQLLGIRYHSYNFHSAIKVPRLLNGRHATPLQVNPARLRPQGEATDETLRQQSLARQAFQRQSGERHRDI